LTGKELPPVEFALRTTPEPILFRDLDIAIVAVEPRATGGEPLEPYGWLRLNPQPGKAFVGEYLTIIQHPKGEHKQVCVRENKLLKYSENGPYLWYETDTVGGSSGSPVFNNAWEVVALHHSSVPRMKKVDGRDVWLAKNGQPWKSSMGDDQIDWMANEGVRISRIAQYLQSQQAGHPLAQAILEAEPCPADVRPVEGREESGGIRVRSGDDGITRILLPIEVGVRLGITHPPAAPARAERPATMAGAGPAAIEKVTVDQSNYDERNGFDTGFLGGGLIVPLPKVTGTRFGRTLPIKGTNPELRYWNYSVVMNRTRRLAAFSAANIDTGKFLGNRDAAGDTWYTDARVDALDKKAQIGREFYKKQRQFEADRTQNPFDQGHLTRRKDLQWGDDDEEAKRNGDDSFHYTNCAPQHWQFNQNNKASGLWFRLEESALGKLGKGQRLCVINGPVFDAPLCLPGSDGRLRLNLRGKRVPDGTFGGVRIPRLFFKVIAYAVAGKLRAKAFVVTQEDLLASIDRYYPAERAPALLSDAEVRLYQVKLADLEKATQLDFGRLSDYDVPAGEESLTLAQGLPVEDESELAF
jgi:endonuclease G